jgi:hypothetical protein
MTPNVINDLASYASANPALFAFWLRNPKRWKNVIRTHGPVIKRLEYYVFRDGRVTGPFVSFTGDVSIEHKRRTT